MRSCRGFERDAVALTFQQANRATGEPLGVTTVIVVAAQFAIGRPVGQDVIGDT
jgi:hypothetical protein